MLGKRVGDDVLDALKRAAFALDEIHQFGKLARHRCRLRRRSGSRRWNGTEAHAGLIGGRFPHRLRPLEDELRQNQQAFRLADRRGQFERGF